MERSHRRAHRHLSYVDTCDDCVRQAQWERYRFTPPPGGAWGGPVARVLNVHPEDIQVLVLNEATQQTRWFSVNPERLCALIQQDLTQALD